MIFPQRSARFSQERFQQVYLDAATRRRRGRGGGGERNPLLASLQYLVLIVMLIIFSQWEDTNKEDNGE